MYYPDARILLFVKAPVPGEVKTRLVPALGAEGACDLYKQLLRGCATMVSQAMLCPVQCWCSPDSCHPVFSELADEFGLTLHEQKGADLGARMLFAATSALQEASVVLLIGVDSPALTGEYLRRALQCLEEGADAVLGPAEDGGYVLLGLNAVDASLFADMPWGTEKVLALTRERLDAWHGQWRELETLWDLDRPEDLGRK